jgi:hypothetical protein
VKNSVIEFQENAPNVQSPKMVYRQTDVGATPKLTAVLSGHGMTKAYLHWFHLSEDAQCRCGNEYQSMDHMLFHCESTKANREDLNEENRNMANKQNRPHH